jgi:hypothetical protein
VRWLSTLRAGGVWIRRETENAKFTEQLAVGTAMHTVSREQKVKRKLDRGCYRNIHDILK